MSDIASADDARRWRDVHRRLRDVSADHPARQLNRSVLAAWKQHDAGDGPPPDALLHLSELERMLPSPVTPPADFTPIGEAMFHPDPT